MDLLLLDFVLFRELIEKVAKFEAVTFSDGVKVPFCTLVILCLWFTNCEDFTVKTIAFHMHVRMK